MPEDRISLPRDDMGDLPYPTNDEIEEQLRQSEELTRWEINMELGLDDDDDDTETWSEDADLMSVSSEYTSEEEEPSEQPTRLFVPTPMEIRHAEAAHNRGRNVARRGRISGTTRTENRNLTPFERGVTFNGFARNLELQEVLGYSLDENGSLLYMVKWSNDQDRIRLVESSLIREYRPLMLVDFHESIILNPQNPQN